MCECQTTAYNGGMPLDGFVLESWLLHTRSVVFCCYTTCCWFAALLRCGEEEFTLQVGRAAGR